MFLVGNQRDPERERCDEMTTSIRCGKEIPLAFKKDDKLTINGIDNVVVAVYDNIASWEIVAVAVITSSTGDDEG